MSAPAAGRCYGCGRPGSGARRSFGGVKGDPHTLEAAVCSEACAEVVRRHAVRRSAQLQPALAGYLVSALGVITAVLFHLSSRDLGKILGVLGVLGLATSRLAYPDVLPGPLVRRFGLARVRESMQWLGVALGLAAVALGGYFVLA